MFVVFTTSLISRHAGILPGMAKKKEPPTPAIPSPISMAIGRRIKECRHEVGKSQETLAFEAQVDRTYISAIERGKSNPSIETVANICSALGYTLAELFATLDDVPLAPTGERRANAATPIEIKRTRLR